MLAGGALVLLSNVVISRENQHKNNIGNLPNGEQWNHSVRVSNKGNDSPECLNNSKIACQHLYYVFENVRHQNSIAVYVEYGDYVLNKSFTFRNVHDFAIIGIASRFGPDMGEVVMNCKENSGLSFIYSSGIVMKNIILSACGTIQNSTSLNHPKFKTGLFLVNCINLSMDKVLVRDGPGIGMQLYDVSGTVSISHSHFLNNGKPKMEDLETKFSGGGLYFEFTFMGGLYPFQKPPEGIYQNNGSFHFMNVTFEGNHAPEIADTVYPGRNQHDAFGRGGGASFFIKGSAQNNRFIFETCYFDKNRAKWGAGLFVEFQDSSLTNSLLFKSCFFRNNNAAYGGGGIRAGLITNHPNTSFAPNYIEFTLCYFEHNKATLGGGISLYGTTKHSYSFFPAQSFVNFLHCVIEWNTATVGSAFCSAVWDVDQYGEGGSSDTFKIYIANSIINVNTIMASSEGGNVSGIGAIYAQGTPVVLKNTNFTFNNMTALVLDSSYVKISGHVYFINNTGQKGGAMSLYGTSKIIVSDNASLIFIENSCSVQGGAIYVKTPGPQMVPFNTTELILHSCFFDFDNDSSGSVSFYNNKGPINTSGHSVYASTLQFCRHPNEHIVTNSALQGKSYHYYYANGTKKYDMKYEIVTDAVNIKVTESEWNTAADKSFSPHVTLYDEKNNSVLGIVKITVHPKKEVKLDPPSTYFLVQDEIKSSLKVIAKPSTNYLVSLETIDSQLAYSPVINATITGCEPGYIWDTSESLCLCDSSPIGVSRCDDQNQKLYLLKDFWAEQVDGKFVSVPCPENYCKCNTTLSASGECLYNKNDQCRGNREGYVCGKCKDGTYLKIGEDECTSQCNSESKKWIGYLVGLIIFSFFLVLIIMLINFDPFTAYLNAWLYFYQVLSILVTRYEFDPFLNFIIGLAHFQLIGFGGVCMWPNLDDLQKFVLNYLLPFFVFISLFVLNKIVVIWPDNFITRRFTQTSLARAFCTLMVLSYSTVVNVSFKILYPVKVGNNYYVFYQGNLKYFSTFHAVLFAFALFLLIFVGMLFPLVLIWRQCFRTYDNGLKKLLLDNFQKCFRDGYKWCAGFYFICRFFLSLIHIFAPRGALQVSLLNSACCIILAVFVFCQPYAENGGSVVPYRILNLSDAVLLCNLCLISSFGGAASGIYAYSYYEQFEVVIYILSYIPLLFSFGLLAYYLRHRFTATQRLLENVDS